MGGVRSQDSNRNFAANLWLTATNLTGIQEAEMERRVTNASRALGESIQKTVKDASTRDDKWKIQLLEELGGEDGDGSNSNADILLQNVSCDRFVQKCVDNDLPPNLIHCLRLLRVLELQHANTSDSHSTVGAAAVEGGAGGGGGGGTAGAGSSNSNSISSVSTEKVRKLFLHLFTDPVVAPQIRPHLFGLLALSGASYPQSGVHIAAAASDAITAFAENCLSNSVVWFLHEKRMIVHMTDDIKELCGMTPVSASSMRTCLYGADAEEAGLWIVALKTVVILITCSCTYKCTELIKDFDEAGGYHVLCFAISNSTQAHVQKLLELLMFLVYCNTEGKEKQEGDEDEDEVDEEMEDDMMENSKLATNVNALEIFDDLMVRSIPFITTYAEEHSGRRPTLTPEHLKDLARFSVEASIKIRRPAYNREGSSAPSPVDLSSELLVTTLQLYSDHAKNFSIVEPRYQILSHYILSFPTFADVSTKVLILKTLEYVCTGLVGSNALLALSVAAQIFFALCRALMKKCSRDSTSGEKTIRMMEDLLIDAQMLCDTIEKLFPMDESLYHIMCDFGLLDDKMKDFCKYVTIRSAPSSKGTPQHAKSKIMDGTYASICRILKMVISQNEISPSRRQFDRKMLNNFLASAIKEHGIESCASALSVFEATLSVGDDSASEDMSRVLSILHSRGSSRELPMSRVTLILNMLKTTLDINAAAQDAFRTCGGYQTLLILLYKRESVIADDGHDKEDDGELVELIETMMALLASSGTHHPSLNNKNVGATMKNGVMDNAARRNRVSLCRTGFFKEFAAAIASTGILNRSVHANSTLQAALKLVDPILLDQTKNQESDEKAALVAKNSSTKALRYADATRLVIGICVNLPQSEMMVTGRSALDEILRLCAPDMAGSTLSLICESGMTKSLTSRAEFGAQLEDRSHPLYSRCMLLLRRVAAFSMAYEDFVSLLRFMAGPMLTVGAKPGHPGRIQLPVISSTVRAARPRPGAAELNLTPEKRSREADFCTRLETLCIIAERGDPVPRCILGGDSLNTIALYMQKVPIQERLYKLGEEGRLKFIEIGKVDESANKDGSAGPANSSSHGSSNANSNNVADRIWAPFASTGFSYSMWFRLPDSAAEAVAGSLFILDLSCQSGMFLSMWYDLQHSQVCVLSSTSARNDPHKFPKVSISAKVWHHIMVTYQPTKRPMLGRKSIVTLYVDGRPLESDVKVENINLPPTAQIHIGAPNPKLAASGVVRGSLPFWELGPSLMLSKVLSSKEATAIYAAGPDFDGLFWGDRPQRMSFTASATALFSMLSDSGEEGSVAGALRRRQVPEVEAAGHVMRERGSHDDSLSSVGLLCTVSPEEVIFGFRPSASMIDKLRNPSKKLLTRRLFNLARISNVETISEDGMIYGCSPIIVPQSFGSNLQWVGGPNILLPLVNASESAGTLSLALRLIRVAAKSYASNLECLQGGGGYRILGLLLRQKRMIDASVLDQCFAFAVHGFVPKPRINVEEESTTWVFTDLDAMKYLLLNHQVWDLRRSGSDLPLRLINFLNGLVSPKNVHAAFNARRLHILGIVQWVLHLMLEAAELYDADDGLDEEYDPRASNHSNSAGSKWQAQAPLVSSVSVGDDPANELLLGCKTLLRRVLTYMLTPGDLDAAAGAAIYTLSISDTYVENEEEYLQPGPVARVYLLRLLEELVVDGVNEIVMTGKDGGLQGVGLGGGGMGAANLADGDASRSVPNHTGGGTAKEQSFLVTIQKKKQRQPPSVAATNSQPSSQPAPDDPAFQLSQQQAQAFLCAFSGILTPTWFACILEGCREEASASAALRLMILLLQSSPTFSNAFEQCGGFAPLVLSIPKFSTCPSIILSMLSQLLHVPILHLPVFQRLDATQLCEVFDAESDTSILLVDHSPGGLHTPLDPSCGIFALLAECLGRNIQLAALPGDVGEVAKRTNEAVLKLLGHRHTFSSSFQEFCRTRDFLEPLAQALCLIHEEKEYLMALRRKQQEDEVRESGQVVQSPPSNDSNGGQPFMMWPGDSGGGGGGGAGFTPDHYRGFGGMGGGGRPQQRRGSLVESLQNTETPTERLVGKNIESEMTGLGMVQLLRHVVSHAVLSGPLAAALISALFHSFPIHATPEQVEAFHLVLIEHSKSVVEDALQRGETFALANCVGVSSVFLDRLMAGFFTSEPILEAVHTILKTLKCLASNTSFASRILGTVDQSMLIAEAAHIARLTCLTALQRSRPRGPYDAGDDDLKAAVLDAMADNLQMLLLAPSVGAGGQKLSSMIGGTGQSATYTYNPPTPGSRSYPLWQSGSLVRCPTAPTMCSFPELKALDMPDHAFVTALMAEIYMFLLDRSNIRDKAVTIVVHLLQQRRQVVSELLVADLSSGDGRVETVDLMRGGGFGALLVQFTAAEVDGNISKGRGRGSRDTNSSNTLTPSRDGGESNRYASFFEWLERNEGQVAAIFHGIRNQASRQGYGVGGSVPTPLEAIEKEQKVMLLKITSQESSDRTILGGLERAELAQRIHEQTAESHSLWKRQGFDDIASGTTQWKVLLRQLKGSRSVWEGLSADDSQTSSPFARRRLLMNSTTNDGATEEKTDDNEKLDNMQLVRWKLDLTEGYERQRVRLVPNYEFQGLYGIDEADDHNYLEGEGSNGVGDGSVAGGQGANQISLQAMIGNVDAKDVSDTAALLKEMDIKTTGNIFEEEEYEENTGEQNKPTNNTDTGDDSDVDDDKETPRDVSAPGTDRPVPSSPEQQQNHNRTGSNLMDSEEPRSGDEDEPDADADQNRDGFSASSYDLITGLLEPGDWPEKSYNVKRCTGLEVRQALLLFCPKALYIIDGFEKTEGDGLEGKINRLEISTSRFSVKLRDKKDGSSGGEETSSRPESSKQQQQQEIDIKKRDQDADADNGISYQHRSQRISFSDLYSVYKRRYQLQPIALEFYDVHRNGILVAFQSSVEREEILTKALNSPLPNSIFSAHSVGAGAINYDRFMNTLRAKITAQWVNGRMSNFEFIMHLNSFAGRSYNDLTQYPVFPWILKNYDTEELDLTDPNNYRDLSRPMGAQSDDRAQHFLDTFDTLDQNYQMDPEKKEPPPYHYSTHYSCAAYVVDYLVRLEPFSRLAITLQGGKFDLADRVFKSIGGSWNSASKEHFQDVRELIPEFFYQPEFLVNSNMFDFGKTQRGDVVDEVQLPVWAKNDPNRFIRMNRQALESEHVSKNLHNWIDLVFGYKQRGREAVKALNQFVHITYEGAVDIDSIENPVLREALIAQIHNFGQTPIRLERKPFPQRNVYVATREDRVDFTVLPSLASLTPPFCIVGAPHRVYLNVTLWDTARVGMKGQPDHSVGDMCLVRGQLVGVGRTCTLILPEKAYYRFGGPGNGVSAHVAISHKDVDHLISVHDGLHRAPITIAKASLNGRYLVTGCSDSTVRVWRCYGKELQLQATLCGHERGEITCIDVSTVFGCLVTGGADGRVLVWDLRRLTFLVELPHDDAEQSTRLGEEVRVTSVSINNRSGQILTLVGSRMRIFDINGNLIATHNSTSSSPFGNHNTPTCAIATDCPGYMEDGVVAVSGHKNGDVMLWGIHYDRKLLVHRHTVPDKVHTSPITALRISGERQDTLLVGDKTGKMSVCKTVRMDCLNQQELSVIMREIRNGGVPSDDFHITGMNSGGGGAGDGGPPQGTNAGFMDMMMTGND
jgi:hypothetical protein